MIITIRLTPETERKLQERAAQRGQTLEGFVEQLLEQEAHTAQDGAGSGALSQSSLSDFDRQLDELSEGIPSLPRLPADWSRADLYADHA